jgi:hypothetical protein
VKAATKLSELIKWGNLVYYSNGPVLMVRAEAQRVLFGFWRGQHLRHIEPRLKPGGKYEMATLELREGDKVEPKIVQKLVRQAAKLNRNLGDPTEAASPSQNMKAKQTGKLKDGAKCKVIAGIHSGKSGIIRDINTSKTGHVTITVVQRTGECFKTLAKNVVIQK